MLLKDSMLTSMLLQPRLCGMIHFPGCGRAVLMTPTTPRTYTYTWTYTNTRIQPFFGAMGCTSAIVFTCFGAAYGTAKSGVGISAMGVLRPDLIVKSKGSNIARNLD